MPEVYKSATAKWDRRALFFFLRGSHTLFFLLVLFPTRGVVRGVLWRAQIHRRIWQPLFVGGSSFWFINQSSFFFQFFLVRFVTFFFLTFGTRNRAKKERERGSVGARLAAPTQRPAAARHWRLSIDRQRKAKGRQRHRDITEKRQAAAAFAGSRPLRQRRRTESSTRLDPVVGLVQIGKKRVRNNRGLERSKKDVASTIQVCLQAQLDPTVLPPPEAPLSQEQDRSRRAPTRFHSSRAFFLPRG